MSRRPLQHLVTIVLFFACCWLLARNLLIAGDILCPNPNGEVLVCGIGDCEASTLLSDASLPICAVCGLYRCFFDPTDALTYIQLDRENSRDVNAFLLRQENLPLSGRPPTPCIARIRVMSLELILYLSSQSKSHLYRVRREDNLTAV